MSRNAVEMLESPLSEAMIVFQKSNDQGAENRFGAISLKQFGEISRTNEISILNNSQFAAIETVKRVFQAGFPILGLGRRRCPASIESAAVLAHGYSISAAVCIKSAHLYAKTSSWKNRS